MLIRQQRLYLGVVQQLGHELVEHIATLQPLAVLGKRRGVPDEIVRCQTNEPAIQQIVFQLLHQLTFRADAIEDLKQQRAQQLLGRDRRATFARIEPPEARAQLGQDVAHKLPDTSQRMPLGYAAFGKNIREQLALILESAAHRASPFALRREQNHSTSRRSKWFLSELLGAPGAGPYPKPAAGWPGGSTFGGLS